MDRQITCKKCNLVKDESEYYPYYLKKKYFYCRECIRLRFRERYKIYISNPNSKERLLKNYRKWYAKHGRRRSLKQNAIGRKWYKNNQVKVSAKNAVTSALRSGKIVKSKVCYFCKKEKKLYAHHPDYLRPLEVIWLCGSCHKKLHYLTQQ